MLGVLDLVAREIEVCYQRAIVSKVSLGRVLIAGRPSALDGGKLVLWL